MEMAVGERKRWGGVEEEIKGGVPLGYSTLGGFTISDQLYEKSDFRLGGRGQRGERLQDQRLSGSPGKSLTGRRE